MDNSIPKCISGLILEQKRPSQLIYYRYFRDIMYLYRRIRFDIIMIHKKTLLTIPILFISVLMNGCHSISSPAYTDNIHEWLVEAPDSCLWYLTAQYAPLMKEKKYQEIEQLYADVLREMPNPPKESKDVNYLTGWILGYYYNALMLQDKVESSEHLTDSLLQSNHSFYTETMRPELLAVSAKFYLAQNRQDRVDSIGKLFLSLPPTDDPRRDARAWHQMAWALEFGDIGTEFPKRLMEHAVESCRKAEGKVGNEGEIYGYMGYIYWKNGELEKAALMIQQTINWYTDRTGTPGDGLIEAYEDLSRVYSSLGLYDKAIEAGNHAIGYSKALDNWMLEDVYRSQAIHYSKMGQPDSSFYYIEKSIEATPSSAEKYYLQRLHIERLGYYYDAYPDSIGSQLEECRRLLKDTAIVDAEPAALLLAHYGRALLHTPGHEREGVESIERSFRTFLSGHYPEGIVQTGSQLINAYIQTGMTDRIASVYPAYIATRDSLEQQKKVNAAIGANIRYETGRKEQENLALTAEVSLKQRTLIFTWLLVGLLATLLVIGGMYLHQRQRYLRQISNARLSQISGLLRTQKELKENNNSLLDMQEELKQSLNEVSSRLDAVSKQKAVSDIRVKISTELLNSDKEAEFRRNFNAIYPDYLISLRQCSSEITPTDELIAMLILLELSNGEIALTLGISKNSVNKARSRMRQRLGLKSEIILEDFLKGISA